MTPLVALEEKVLVAGQIGPGDMDRARAAGVTMIVNNRPDGEEPGQPSGAEIEHAAGIAGLSYRHIPVVGLPARQQVEAMAEALDQADGRLLAFCRSGTRSTWLWALARAGQGEDRDRLVALAASAGYDLSALRTYSG